MWRDLKRQANAGGIKRRPILAGLAGLLGISGAGAVLLPGLVPSSEAQASIDGVGEIVKLRGQARLVRSDRNLPIDVGTSVSAGDNLMTGPESRLKVKFRDGSEMTLGEESKLTVERADFDPATGDRDISGNLLDGIVRAVVAKVDGQSNFELKTAMVTSAARSTQWILEARGPSTSLVVLEGTVNAQASEEGVKLDPKAEIAKGVDLKPEIGITMGEPARMLGVPAKDLGRPVKWGAVRIQKLRDATDI